MNPYSIKELKNELTKYTQEELLAFCLRLARFKKENKELLGFIVFQSGDINGFSQGVKEEMDGLFEEINKSNIYYIKKGVRKILRNINKYSRFAASPQVEAELLIHFCNNFQVHSIPLEKSKQLKTLYENQQRKIEQALSSLHPDLEYDLKRQMLKNKI